MKRSTKKVLGLAASSVLFSGTFFSPALANTYTWQTTGIGNSQDWFNTGNWSSSTVPGASDTGFFNVAPPSNTISVGSNASVGAIFAEIAGSPNLTIGGAGALTLSGQTITVPQFGQTLPAISNVVLALGSSTGAVQTNSLTVSNNIALTNAQNVIVASSNNSLSAAGQTVTLSGNISNAGATAAQLTLLGGGNTSDFGALYKLTGTNSFTGGMVIGTTAANQGAEVLVNPSALPTTGTITVNEQSQLELNGANTYGAGTTLSLDSPGVGPGISQGSSGALRTSGAAGNFIWAGALNIGTTTTNSTEADYVVISATGSNTISVSGQLIGTGSLQKQGGGTLLFTNANNTWNGSLQVGNGAVSDTATSSIGDGDLLMYQSSNNTTTVNLFNANQSIRNLGSSFTGLSTGTDTQVVNLNSTTLTINATTNSTFGYGAAIGLSSMLQDGTASNAGGVVYHGNPGVQLNLTGPNTYHGGTTISGGILNLANGYNGSTLGVNGSALGVGDVTVNSGGTLSSGAGVAVVGQTVTAGGFSGNLIVNNGGIVTPGGANLVGMLGVGGGITAHTGSIFDFDLAGGTTSSVDTLTAGGPLTLDNGGTETVNILGSKLAYGTYTLATYGALANSGTQFTIGANPGGRNRTYSLTTNANSLILNIVDNGNERYWSVGGVNPTVDGAGAWQSGSTSFFNSNPATTQAPYNNASNDDVVFGNGGNGGSVSLGGAVRVGGALVFSAVNTPYTIGANGGNTLELAGGANGGIIGSANATIHAPIILDASQTFTAAAGTTLTIDGGMSESTPGVALTKDDLGTLLLGGTNTYSGGTIIANGVLEASTSSLPSSGGVQINNSGASLVFSQSTNGTYGGQISGTGSVSVNGTGTVGLSSSLNSYSGATNLESGVLSIGSTGALGTEAGGIQMSGGTLQFTSHLNFPLGSPSRIINLVSGTSTIDTDGNDVTMGQNLIGSGNLTKIGAGELTFTGLIPTTIIGQVSVLGGSLNFSPTVGASYGFAASSSPGTFTGDLILGGSLEMRLQGGEIDGGGKVRIVSSGVNLISRGATVINNEIVLNEDNIANFIANIGATAGNTMTINSAITGTSDVDFTGGAGTTVLTGASSYSGATTIDSGSGGEIQLAANNTLPAATDVHVTGSGQLDVFGVTQMIGSLDSGAAPTGAIVTNNSTSNGLLIVNGSKNTNFAGFIEDNANTVGGGGTLGIELGSNCTGTLNLNGTVANTYAGGTTLNGGTLIVSNDQVLGFPTGGLTFGGGTLDITATTSSSTRPLTVNPGSSTIDVAPTFTYSLGGSSNITWAGGTLNTTDSGAVTLAQTGGTVLVTPGSTLSVASTSSVAVSGSVDPFTDSSNPAHHVAIVNNGAFSVVGVNSSIAGINGTGNLTLGDGVNPNTLQLATGSGGSSQNVVTINTGSKLDITNNHLIINYGASTDPASSIYNLLKSGYNGGTWTGVGIDSSTAALLANHANYGVGFVDGADNIPGATVTSGQILVAYALYGDVNLDGLVNATDFAVFGANFNTAVTGWEHGDFTYTGLVNATDFALLGANFGKSASGAAVALPQSDYAALDAFAAANGLALPSVPEPASLGLVTLGAIGVLARRRRR